MVEQQSFKLHDEGSIPFWRTKNSDSPCISVLAHWQGCRIFFLNVRMEI